MRGSFISILHARRAPAAGHNFAARRAESGKRQANHGQPASEPWQFRNASHIEPDAAGECYTVTSGGPSKINLRAQNEQGAENWSFPLE